MILSLQQAFENEQKEARAWETRSKKEMAQMNEVLLGFNNPYWSPGKQLAKTKSRYQRAEKLLCWFSCGIEWQRSTVHPPRIYPVSPREYTKRGNDRSDEERAEGRRAEKREPNIGSSRQDQTDLINHDFHRRRLREVKFMPQVCRTAKSRDTFALNCNSDLTVTHWCCSSRSSRTWPLLIWQSFCHNSLPTVVIIFEKICYPSLL